MRNSNHATTIDLRAFDRSRLKLLKLPFAEIKFLRSGERSAEIAAPFALP
jgi:hypothetical protein